MYNHTKKLMLLSVSVLLMLAFSLVAAMPALAAEFHVGAGQPYATIQAAIDAAGADDTVVVHTGTYTEDISISAAKTNLELRPATGDVVTIKGIATEPWTNWPLATPNIESLASGVKIHGFNIESPDVPDGSYSSGIVLDGTNIEIYENSFVSIGAGDGTGDDDGGNVVIQTYRDDVLGYNSDISGLDIHNNEFSGTPAGQYVGVFINHTLTGTGTVYVQNNNFTGNIAQGVVTERSNTTISQNQMTSDQTPAIPYSIAIIVQDFNDRAEDNVQVIDNIIKGSAPSNGFVTGMRIGSATSQVLTNIAVTGNTFEGNGTGVLMRSSADGVAMHFNNIAGNATGVQNNDAATLDAELNWWGDGSGPTHASNPDGTGDAVSDNVDFDPWLGASIADSKTETGTGDFTVDATAEANTEVTVTGTGETTVTVASYSENPGATVFGGQCGFIDVNLSDVTEVTQVVIRFYCAGAEAGGYRMRWWDGTSWVLCSNQNAVNGYVEIVITADTMPSLTDLTGTPFTAGNVSVGGEVFPVTDVQNPTGFPALWVALGLALMLSAIGGVLVLRRVKIV